MKPRTIPPRPVLAVALFLGWVALALRACNLPAKSAALPGPASYNTRSGPAEIYAKVVRVDKESQEVEVKFLIQPKETRVVFSGDPRKILVGDFVKFQLDGPTARVAGTEMKCQKVIWVLE